MGKLAQMKKVILLAAILLHCALAHSAPAEHDVETTSHLGLGQFRVNHLSHVTNGYHWVATGQVAWAPSFKLDPHFSIVGLLGGALFTQSPSKTFFPALNLELLGGIHIPHWRFELGGGYEGWFAQPQYLGHWKNSSNLFLVLDRKLFGMVREFFVGYSVLYTSGPAHQIRLGFAIEL